MNEKKIYIARLKAYKCMLNLYTALSRELKTKTKPMSKRKAVRPALTEKFHEISMSNNPWLFHGFLPI